MDMNSSEQDNSEPEAESNTSHKEDIFRRMYAYYQKITEYLPSPSTDS